MNYHELLTAYESGSKKGLRPCWMVEASTLKKDGGYEHVASMQASSGEAYLFVRQLMEDARRPVVSLNLRLSWQTEPSDRSGYDP